MTVMLRSITIFLILLGSTCVLAQDHRPEIHCKHFFKGYPYGAPLTNDLIIRDIYALNNNDDTKLADWVCYRITMHEVDGDLDVERKWRADDWLDESETLEPKGDYDGANTAMDVDRGHQAPLASFKGSRYASQSNFLSNITPQKAPLNQGPWKNLEEAERDIVRSGKTLYVMTGPLYERQMPSLPNADEPHKVPSGYWKILILEEGRSFQLAAFIMDQESGRKDKVMSKVVSVDQVEKRSGLDFLWELEDGLEKSVEAISTAAWMNQFVN